MRIRSLHPKYLDKAWLVACRRETLLAKHVLLGKTKGYKYHPQLLRFKESDDPIQAIDSYLFHLHQEAKKRNYNFDAKKFNKSESKITIIVHDEQLHYEFQHLMKKLKTRDPKKHWALSTQQWELIAHPLFKVKEWPVHEWEKR